MAEHPAVNRRVV